MKYKQLLASMNSMKVGEILAVCTPDHVYKITKEDYLKKNQPTYVFYDEFEPMVLNLPNDFRAVKENYDIQK